MLARLARTRLQRWAAGSSSGPVQPLPALHRPIATSPVVGERGAGEDDAQTERSEWLDSFETFQQTSSTGLPKEWVSTSFSRSSGPGGQNVNKLNTKAEVRLNLAAASQEQSGVPWMPRPVVRYLSRLSPYYVASSHSLMVTSMKTRTQSGNLQDALDKLHEHLRTLLSQGIAGETSAEQRAKVKSLIARDKARTRKSKEKRSNVKRDRKAGGGGFDF